MLGELLPCSSRKQLSISCCCVWAVITADKAEGEAETTGLPSPDWLNLTAFFPLCQTESHAQLQPCSALSIVCCSARIPVGCSPSLGCAVLLFALSQVGSGGRQQLPGFWFLAVEARLLINICAMFVLWLQIFSSPLL